MPETLPLLERVMERVELRPFTLEGFHDRRDRKRRNQRITAGVVGIVVFVAAVWIMMSGLSFDRTETPAVPGTVTGPTESNCVVTRCTETGPVVETGPTETGPADTGPTETAPPSAPASAAPDVVTQERCSAGARWRLELTKVDSRIKVRFEVYRSPVGHEWRIRLLHHHNRFLDPPPWPKARVFFQGTRVASDSGVLAVQVFNHPPPDWSGWLYAGNAVDEQTGQACEARGGIE